MVKSATNNNNGLIQLRPGDKAARSVAAAGASFNLVCARSSGHAPRAAKQTCHPCAGLADIMHAASQRSGRPTRVGRSETDARLAGWRLAGWQLEIRCRWRSGRDAPRPSRWSAYWPSRRPSDTSGVRFCWKIQLKS
jgi:hypothetical protein